MAGYDRHRVPSARRAHDGRGAEYGRGVRGHEGGGRDSSSPSRRNGAAASTSPSTSLCLDLQPFVHENSTIDRKQDNLEMQRTFEGVQVGMMLQARRHEACVERLTRVENEVSHVAALGTESEDLRATERRSRHETLASLTRRMEDATLTCDTLRRGQEHIVSRIERSEPQLKEAPSAELLNQLRYEVDVMRDVVQNRIEDASNLARRLSGLEPLLEDSKKLREETRELRNVDDQYDLEVAAVRGQIDALSKLVYERNERSQAFADPMGSRR